MVATTPIRQKRKAVPPLVRYRFLLDSRIRRKLAELTADQWADAVDSWNSLTSEQRKGERAVCSKRGHIWVLSPLGTQMCHRCMEHATD